MEKNRVSAYFLAKEKRGKITIASSLLLETFFKINTINGYFFKKTLLLAFSPYELQAFLVLPAHYTPHSTQYLLE